MAYSRSISLSILGVVLLSNTPFTEGQFASGGFLDLCTGKHLFRLKSDMMNLHRQMSGSTAVTKSEQELSTLGSQLGPTAAGGLAQPPSITHTCLWAPASGTMRAPYYTVARQIAAGGISPRRAPIVPSLIRSETTLI